MASFWLYIKQDSAAKLFLMKKATSRLAIAAPYTLFLENTKAENGDEDDEDDDIVPPRY